MKTYDTYKPSGIEWIGDIPEHWEMKKFKYFYRFSMGATILKTDLIDNGKIPVYSATESDTIFGYVDYSNVILELNDFVIPARGISIGYIYLVEQESTCTQTTIYAKFNKNKGIVSKFVFYYQKGLREQLFQFDRTAIPQITVDQVKSNFLIIPSVEEQNKIALYLDYKTAQIDRIIANKQKLIALYEDEKISIINQAITRGINKSVAFKDSGVEWLSETPEHWKVKKLGYMGRCQNGISIGGDSFGSGYPFVSYGDVYKNVCLPLSVDGLVNSTEKDRIAYSVEKGDVFFTRTSETSEEIGIASVCMSTIEDATFAGFLIRFRPYSNLLVSSYSKYYFRSQLHRYYFVKEMNIVTRASLSQGLLRNLVVLLPPLEEQVEIANYLDNECLRLNTLIDKFKKQIELFQEYRTTLISEVVTGKVKV